MYESKVLYGSFRFAGRSVENQLRMLAVVATFGLMPGCDSAVDPPNDSAGSDGSTTSSPPGGSSSGGATMTSAPPFTTSPGTSSTTTTTTPPNPTTPSSAVTTAGTFSTGSSGFFGSSGSGVGPETCGNGAVDFAEQCDGADLFGFSCEALGLGEGVLICSEVCLFDTSDCVGALPDCGDGLVQPGEQCDQANLQGLTCDALGLGGGNLACSLGCTFDTSGCLDGSDCGNGVVNPGEQCDGNDLQGLDCVSLGLGAGELTCDNVQCTFDTSGCG